MTGFKAFVKKEWMESLKSYRLFLMLIIFTIIGIMNPFTAKITPDLIKNFMPKGITVEIQEVSALDSWQQFFKNVPQMGLIVLTIIYSSVVAKEFSKGTLIPLITKGLSRNAIIMSKLCVATFVWTISYIICVALSWGYTVYFWSSKGINNVPLAVLAVWIFGIMLLSLTIFGGVLFKTVAGSMLFTGFCVVLMTLINMIPRADKYNPLFLISKNMSLIKGILVPSNLIMPIIITLAITFTSLIGSCIIFNKTKI